VSEVKKCLSSVLKLARQGIQRNKGENPRYDEDTGMWRVCPECDEEGQWPIQIIHLDTILCGIHLLPCYGEGLLQLDLTYSNALDACDSYFINQFIDCQLFYFFTCLLSKVEKTESFCTIY
jgi:hypothetical protein